MTRADDDGAELADPSTPALPPEDQDYLFSKRGPPDPLIARLEQQLAPLAYQQPIDELALRRRRRWWWVAAPVVAAAAALALWLWRASSTAPESSSVPRSQQVAFAVANGTALHDGRAAGSGSLTVGGKLVTQDHAAELVLPHIGRAELGPNSSLTVQAVDAQQQRLALARGRLEATVIAPPRLFVVETPKTTVVDLGCAYTIEVDGSGHGEIVVTSGLVELAVEDQVIVVVHGTRARLGDARAIPMAVDADPQLAQAIVHLATNPPPADRAADWALDVVKQRAAIDDTVALVHLLRWVAPEQRAELVTALASLAGRPADVDREAVIRGEPAALTAWRTFVVNHWLWRGRP